MKNNSELMEHFLRYESYEKTLRDLMDSIGYPDVPYDSVTKKVEYEFISALDGISRDIIINRESEWAAVSFGSTDGLLTNQGSTSRLILNGSLELLFPDIFMVFTIKDGKMKSRIVNISYEYTDPVGDRTVSRTLNSCFPISNNEQDEWKATITLVNETRESLKAMIALLGDYIKDYESDYNW